MKGRHPGGQLRKPRWDLGSLKPFSKNFYIPHPNVSSRYVIPQLMELLYC
jgi:ATP-dependent RNA helicase DDX5/DBP2